MKLIRELCWGYWEEFHYHTLICLLLLLKPETGSQKPETGSRKPETGENVHRLALVLNLTGPESPRDKCLGTLTENYLDWLSFWSCL